jgi:hypothetical protein
LAWQALENLRQQQASSLAYFDVFFLMAVVTLVLAPVVLLMKRSAAEKGARIGGEKRGTLSTNKLSVRKPPPICRIDITLPAKKCSLRYLVRGMVQSRRCRL